MTPPARTVALVSTPWPLFNRPSIQLGALKAYVRRHLPGVAVRAHHLYLPIAARLGYALYGRISEHAWLSEAPYAALLYPEQRETVSRFWKRRAPDLPGLRRDGFEEFCRALERHSARILDAEDWDRYFLAGFSVCFGQLTSTLYFIREIKKRAPAIRIVAGGSACAGDLGRSLSATFPEIDYVIGGEGERPLLELIRGLTDGRPPARREEAILEGDSQIPRLDDLPVPDYDDYFASLDALEPHLRFMPKLPMEISRGCWWRKGAGEGGPSGCSFCNLNLQWRGYRSKSTGRALRELASLVRRYQVLSVSFMDNLLPARGLETLFDRIRKMEAELHLFCEIRATTPFAVLAAMGAAGVREVQAGIESLSTRLLGKLNKGTTAMDNLEMMKTCEARGMPDLTANLILNFPSSDAEDVAETLKNLMFALPFKPLKGIPFWLGYGSRVWRLPAAYGIRRVRNHPFYAHLFPPRVLRDLKLMMQGYQGGVRRQERLWKPVREKLAEWRRTYGERRNGPERGPLLSYRDGGDFMIIRERMGHGLDMTHRLKGTSRKIYLFCGRRRSMDRIAARFPGFGEEKIRPFLRMMVDKRLMFSEGENYLSLAVPARGWPGGGPGVIPSRTPPGFLPEG